MAGRRLLGVTVAVGLLVSGGAQSAAAAIMATPSAAPVDGAGVDELSGLPRLAAATNSNTEGVGDVLGLGYEQRVVLDGDTVKIYGPTDAGEPLLSSFKAIANTTYHTHRSLFEPIEGFQNLQHHGFFKPMLAVGTNAIYVTEPINGSSGSPFTEGSMIRRWEWFPQLAQPRWIQNRMAEHRGGHVVTAIATGMVGGTEVVAVGLNKHGARIHRADTLAYPANGYMFANDWNGYRGWQPPAYARDHVTAIGIGKIAGRGDVLFLGRMTTEAHAIHAYDAAANTDTSFWNIEHRPHQRMEDFRYPTSFAFGDRDTSGAARKIVATWNRESQVVIFDPKTQQELGRTGELHSAGRWARFFPAADGTEHLAVALDHGGRAFRYSPGTGTKLTELPIGDHGRTMVNPTEFLDWFPGYKSFDLTVVNDSRNPIDVTWTGSTDADKGCWIAASLPAAAALPTGASTSFRTGYYTVGNPVQDADCQRVERGMFLTAAPAGAHRVGSLIARLFEENGALITDPEKWVVTDGTLQVSLTRNTANPHPFGWTVTIADAIGEPVLATDSEPTLEATRLTAAAGSGTIPDPNSPTDPMYPVYRIQVDGIAWTIPDITKNNTATVRVPSAFVQAIDADDQIVDLGYLESPAAPTRDADTLHLGPATFFVQNAPKTSPYTKIRVTIGDRTVETTLDQPAPQINLGGDGDLLHMTPKTGMGTDLTPIANGLDQAPFTIAIQDAYNHDVPADDPRWSLIHYRDADNNSLITGLIDPQRPNRHISITPTQGAYHNLGTLAATTTAPTHYVTTRDTGQRKIEAQVNTTGTKRPLTASTVHTLNGNSPLPQVDGPITKIVASGNQTFTPPTLTAPAPYATNDPAHTYYQLHARAVTGNTAIPVPTASNLTTNPHLTHVPIVFTNHNKTATIHNPNDFSYLGEPITTHLTVRGILVTTETRYSG